MTLLEGQFAMAIVLEAGMISDGRLVEQALSEVAEELDLFVAVRPINSAPEPFESTTTMDLKMSGVNQPGIVATITTILAAVGADIRHLESWLVDDSDVEHPGYAMDVSVALPVTSDRSALESEILRAMRELGGTCTITPSDASAP
jgi:glycine cleavage system regulatory protein